MNTENREHRSSTLLSPLSPFTASLETLLHPAWNRKYLHTYPDERWFDFPRKDVRGELRVRGNFIWSAIQQSI